VADLGSAEGEGGVSQILLKEIFDDAFGVGWDADTVHGASLNALYKALSGGAVLHNWMGGKQGGTAAEYYHLTSAQHTQTIILDKLDATQAPTVDNDVTEGYSVGSWWFDVTNDKAYTCLDATEGAAVWQEVGAGEVSADANLTDDMILRGKGGAKGIQTSLVKITDAGDVIVPDTQGVHTGTTDGSDSKMMFIGGGGGGTTVRGAYIRMYGNENAGQGVMDIGAGNVDGGYLYLSAGAATRISISPAGLIVLADAAQLATIAAPTADAQIANKKYVDDTAGGGNCSIVTGTYTGDGSTDQAIDTGIVGQVKLVRIWKDRSGDHNDNSVYERTDSMQANISQEHLSTTWYAEQNQINATDADGEFHVDDAGADAHPNKNSTAYVYVAFIEV